MKNVSIIKRIVDILMCISILFLMAYQVTGDATHEYLGMLMVLLIIIHQVLNKGWYKILFKGKYNAKRIIILIVNIGLIISFVLTAVSGVAMSSKATPFLYGIIDVSIAREIHLAVSHLVYLFIALHLGLHLQIMLARIKSKKKLDLILNILFIAMTIFGIYIFIQNKHIDYILMKEKFAFFDYDKNKILVILENLCELFGVAYITNFVFTKVK